MPQKNEAYWLKLDLWSYDIRDGHRKVDSIEIESSSFSFLRMWLTLLVGIRYDVRNPCQEYKGGWTWSRAGARGKTRLLCHRE